MAEYIKARPRNRLDYSWPNGARQRHNLHGMPKVGKTSLILAACAAILHANLPGDGTALGILYATEQNVLPSDPHSNGRVYYSSGLTLFFDPGPGRNSGP